MDILSKYQLIYKDNILLNSCINLLPISYNIIQPTDQNHLLLLIGTKLHFRRQILETVIWANFYSHGRPFTIRLLLPGNLIHKDHLIAKPCIRSSTVVVAPSASGLERNRRRQRPATAIQTNSNRAATDDVLITWRRYLSSI